MFVPYLITLRFGQKPFKPNWVSVLVCVPPFIPRSVVPTCWLAPGRLVTDRVGALEPYDTSMEKTKRCNCHRFLVKHQGRERQ